jgi:hypothetical protein
MDLPALLNASARSLLVSAVLALSLSSTPTRAAAQIAATMSGWQSVSQADPTGGNLAIVSKVAPTGIPGVAVRTQIECVDDRVNFWITLLGASFDVDKQSLLHGRQGAFGTVDITGNTYQYIHYDRKIDSQAWENDETYNATADGQYPHAFGAFFLMDEVLGESRLLIRAKTKGQPVTVQVDLNNPYLSKFIGSCDTSYRESVKEKEAKEKAEKEAALEKAVKDEERAKQEKKDTYNKALTDFLGLGPIPNDTRGAGILLKITTDVHGYSCCDWDKHPRIGSPSGRVDPSIEMNVADSAFKDEGVVRAGAECILYPIGIPVAKILFGKKYVEVRCEYVGPGGGFVLRGGLAEYVPVDALVFSHQTHW